ncbi:MAG TPA: SPOR domain-containing protein [Myxococcales bacterium]|jgi:cell division septation protein DedD
MRDAEGMREKVQVSLEGRQIAALSVGALLLLCSVFALGLALGRRLSQEPPRPAELTALDAQAAEPAPQKPAQAAEPAPQKPAQVVRPTRPTPAAETSLADTKKGAVAIVPPPPREPLVVPPPAQRSSGPVSLTPPPRDIGAYTVQIGASPDRAEALRLENRARAAGYKPYSVEANLGAKGTWYRVRVGSFPDKDRALRYRSDVERELRQAAIVMASH